MSAMLIGKRRAIAAMVAVPMVIIAALIARPAKSPVSVAPGVRALSGPAAVSPDKGTTDTSTFAAAATTTSAWIKNTYPKQAAAKQVRGDPATYRWALLIGLNDYAGSTVSNVGSRQDAETLNEYLIKKMRWRRDHIIVIKDLNGTASHIIEAIRWLASKATASSTVVFHYAGHENWTRTTADGDNESRDVALWAADNKLVLDGTLGKEMGKVRAKRMWINLATCRAGGFEDAGMVKSGRIITYSSPESELSYEDPDLQHSVFGWFILVQGMMNKNADSNRSGGVSIEEAFSYAKKRTTTYTSGRQHPVLIDRADGSMGLTIPAKPSSSSPPQPTPKPSSSLCLFVCL